jgi:hypothetical protein
MISQQLQLLLQFFPSAQAVSIVFAHNFGMCTIGEIQANKLNRSKAGISHSSDHGRRVST